MFYTDPIYLCHEEKSDLEAEYTILFVYLSNAFHIYMVHPVVIPAIYHVVLKENIFSSLPNSHFISHF